jgi:hypothetical protein
MFDLRVTDTVIQMSENREGKNVSTAALLACTRGLVRVHLTLEQEPRTKHVPQLAAKPQRVLVSTDKTLGEWLLQLVTRRTRA